MSKIAFVTEVYTDSNFQTGGEKLNYILLKELKNLDYSIDIFCNKISFYAEKFIDNFYSMKQLEDLRQNYDYILSDKGFIPTDITYIHGHSYPFRTKHMSNKFKTLFSKIFNAKKHKKRFKNYQRLKESLNKTKKIIVSSKILRNDIIENYVLDPRNVIIIPPPIEKHEVQPRNKNDIFTFGISATGFKRKGGYILLKAIKELKKYKYDFKVIFIYPSDNFFVKLCQKLYGIEKYCEFIEIQKDMNEFYNSIDCLIMPSMIEPFGMVATEALSNGCPVITAKHCGAADFITEGKNGFLYNGLKNPEKELAKTMSNVLALDKEVLLNMSDFCINSVRNCCAENFAKQYIEIFKTINKESN